jgi:hypothetical protein
LRAPTIVDVTPTLSRTQESATSRGENPSPCAAIATASTTLDELEFKYGSRNEAKCGEAALESDGIPFRYFPVSTPRPRGAQAKKPTPNEIAQGITSSSETRLTSEYSFCNEMTGAFIELLCCNDIALALCHPEKFESPT